MRRGVNKLLPKTGKSNGFKESKAVNYLPIPSDKILSAWSKRIQKCLGVKVTKETMLLAFYYCSGYWFRINGNNDRFINKKKKHYFNGFDTTGQKESLTSAVTIIKFGMPVPRFGDSEQYKTAFEEKLKLFTEL